MTKKILPLTMLVTLMIFVGCASAPEMTVEERFDTIMLQADEVDYMDTSSNGIITMVFDAEDLPEPIIMDMTTNQDVILDMSDKDNIKAYQNVAMSGMGENMSMELYILDNISYMETLGIKMKTALNPADLAQYQEDVSPLMMYSADMDALTMEKVDNKYIITYNVSPDKIENYREFFDTIIESAGAGTDIKIEFDFINGTYTVFEDNTISEATVNMGMTMYIENEVLTATAEMDYFYNSYNKPVTIEYPNLEEYIEFPTN